MHFTPLNTFWILVILAKVLGFATITWLQVLVVIIAPLAFLALLIVIGTLLEEL